MKRSLSQRSLVSRGMPWRHPTRRKERTAVATRRRARARWTQVVMAGLLWSLCSCASTSQERRSSPAPAPGGPSAGTRAGEGLATSMRYVFGFPMIALGLLFAGPDHWGEIPSGIQKVRDYEPGQPPETGDSVLRSNFR
jgi:hypothetical protein